jgi:hypothetical protein
LPAFEQRVITFLDKMMFISATNKIAATALTSYKRHGRFNQEDNHSRIAQTPFIQYEETSYKVTSFLLRYQNTDVLVNLGLQSLRVS